ncbi:hypothetical protein [Streptomyces sp. NPDC091212]|uniref:hypothetical protein n=1 Tax=Streptomyces sp. NPDC091212 TaxID=3155191 RepID=UPI0034193040
MSDDEVNVSGAEKRSGGARRWLLPVVGGVVLVAAGVGAGWALWGSGSGGGEFTLRGEFVLASGATRVTMDDDDASKDECAGYDGGGTGDIVPGAPVTVYDSAGAVVATGALGRGQLPEGGDGTAPCTFAVTVDTVPNGSKFYQVEVGGRGKTTVPEDEAKAGGFVASLG